MKRHVLICALAASVAPWAASGAAEDAVRDSVVRITVTQRLPNFTQPWTKAPPRDGAGTGFVIDGKRILTNAHVVSYATQIYIQPNRSADKIPAKVILTAPSIDLALLSIDDPQFFDARPAIPFANGLPKVKTAVNVYGFPVGGEQLSVTEGIISRVEYAAYYLGTSGLRVQIDAALNFGNSGGPAVSDGKLVGVAYSGITTAENIGYLIPTDEIRMFLDDVQDGKYDGKARLYDSLQSVQNDALRAKLGLPVGVGGAMVQAPFRTDENYPLKPNDVITHIGEHALDAAGNVQVAPDLQLPFTYYIPKLAQDDKVKITVFGGGQSSERALPVRSQDRSLIGLLQGGYPRYFIYGPLAFSVPSRELLSLIGEQGRAILREAHSPLVRREQDDIGFEGEELVMLTTSLFAHPIAKGYHATACQVLAEVNGAPIKNLAHLVELLRDSQAEFLEFRFAGRLQETLVFRRAELIAATEDILSDNSIRKQCSDDLLPLWTAAGKAASR
jgi:S1-C subfamily serine protease